MLIVLRESDVWSGELGYTEEFAICKVGLILVNYPLYEIAPSNFESRVDFQILKGLGICLVMRCKIHFGNRQAGFLSLGKHSSYTSKDTIRSTKDPFGGFAANLDAWF